MFPVPAFLIQSFKHSQTCVRIRKKISFYEQYFHTKMSIFWPILCYDKLFDQSNICLQLLSLNYYCKFSLELFGGIILFCYKKLDSFNNILSIVHKKYPMIIGSCKLTCQKQSNPWVSHFKTMKIKTLSQFNSSKIQQMVLILGINLLPFSCNIWW